MVSGEYREHLKQSHWTEQPWCDQGRNIPFRRSPRGSLPAAGPEGQSIAMALPFKRTGWRSETGSAWLVVRRRTPQRETLDPPEGENQSRDQALYFKGVCVCVCVCVWVHARMCERAHISKVKEAFQIWTPLHTYTHTRQKKKWETEMRDCLSDVSNVDTEAMGGTAQLEIYILTLSHFLRKTVNIVVFIYFCKKSLFCS